MGEEVEALEDHSYFLAHSVAGVEEGFVQLGFVPCTADRYACDGD